MTSREREQEKETCERRETDRGTVCPRRSRDVPVCTFKTLACVPSKLANRISPGAGVFMYV